MNNTKLPLFLLNTVLFPGVPLTLHVFEERYRLMIDKCLHTSTPFGILFVGQSEQSNETQNLIKFGTVAQINASVRLEDGRFLIHVIGQQRFRILKIMQFVPYLVASIELLAEENEGPFTDTSDKLKQLYNRYWEAVASATGTLSQEEQLPDDALGIIYHLAHRMQITNQRKQHWLEADLETRIREITMMLQSEMLLLPPPINRYGPEQSNSRRSWN